jgi:inosose dehydratase
MSDMGNKADARDTGDAPGFADPIRVASAPCSFGVDEVIVEDIWMPEPDEMLGWMADLGYEGTELGPPGYLGDGELMCERLAAHGLEFIGTFLPQTLTDDERCAKDREWMAGLLSDLRRGLPAGAQPFAVLSAAIDTPVRKAATGRVDRRPDARLDDGGWARLVANLHRSAERAASLGFRPVIHPHAGTYLETAGEIDRLVDAMDPSIVGLCLDTGHFRFGGADPARCLRDYASVVRHVHVKDCRIAVLDGVVARGEDVVAALAGGVFSPLGEGDADIPAVVGALRDIGYAGWVVVEQDQFLGASDTRETVVAGQRANREYLRALGL